MAMRHPHGDRDAVRITTAPANRAQEIAARQRRYVISMSIRTVCFVAAVAVGPGWLRWVLVAAAVLLPYVAVVMANATDNRDDAFSLEGAPRAELPGTGATPRLGPQSGAAATGPEPEAQP